MLRRLLPIKLADAEIRAIAPAGATHRVRFILKTYKLEKKNDLARSAHPDSTASRCSLSAVTREPLSMVLYFDERSTNTDVRQSMKSVADL